MTSDRSIVSGDFELAMDELREVARYVLADAIDVLPMFEATVPDDPRPCAAIEAAHRFAEHDDPETGEQIGRAHV